MTLEVLTVVNNFLKFHLWAIIIPPPPHPESGLEIVTRYVHIYSPSSSLFIYSLFERCDLHVLREDLEA